MTSILRPAGLRLTWGLCCLVTRPAKPTGPGADRLPRDKAREYSESYG